MMPTHRLLICAVMLLASISIIPLYGQDEITKLSPVKQTKLGIGPSDVRCETSKVLIISNSGNPACVIPQTALKLFQRGWGWTYINGNMYAIQYKIKNIPLPDMISIVQNRTSSLDTVIEQGGTVQIPWEFKLEHNFTLFDVQLEIYSPSEKIKLWLNPVFPDTIVNGEKPGNKTITIYADPNTQPGNYTATITDVGYIKNQKYDQYFSLKNSTIGILHLAVKPHKPQISIDIGYPNYHGDPFCVNTEPSGKFCVSFTTYQEFPIKVYSQNKAMVDLSVSGIPDGVWIKFIPEKLIASPNGTKAKLLMAGLDVAYGGNPLAEKALIIHAKSNDALGAAVLSVRTGNHLAILHSVGSFQLGSTILNSNQTGMLIPAVVYDPSDNSNSTLQVKLSPLGMANGSKIIPFPSWFSVKILKPSFTLYADQPYYFIIQTKTSNAPLYGNFTFAVDEEVNGTHFIGNATITLQNIRY